MKSWYRALLWFPLCASIGCSVSPPNPIATASWTNWQIQAGSAITSPPNSFPSFTGAIDSAGAQPTAIFTSVANNGGASQIVNFTGSVNAVGAVTLLADGYQFQFTPPTVAGTVVPVNVTGGCVGLPPGPECTAIFQSPSVGIEIGPPSGAYAGTLTTSSPGGSGAAVLTLTQSSTPDSTGAFALTGTLTLPAGVSPSPIALAGSVSGEGISLASVSGSGPTVIVAAAASPNAAQITVSNLKYSDPSKGASVIYTGVLTRQ